MNGEKDNYYDTDIQWQMIMTDIIVDAGDNTSIYYLGCVESLVPRFKHKLARSFRRLVKTLHPLCVDLHVQAELTSTIWSIVIVVVFLTTTVTMSVRHFPVLPSFANLRPSM